MSVASTAWIWTVSLALAAALLAVHLRFTLRNATLSAFPLLCGGVLGPLLALMLDHAELPASASVSLRASLTPLLIGLAGAASVRIRYLVAGIPAALAVPPGPSNTDLLAAIALHDKGLELAVGDIRRAQTAWEQAGKAQLAALQAFVADTGRLLEKHRMQQMETMHHERRSADQIGRSVQEFHALLAQSEELATLAGQVRQALELLGPRQEALGASLDDLTQDLGRANDGVAGLHSQLDAALAEFALRSRRPPDGMGQRMGQNSGELQQALQRAAEQTRTHISDIAGKHQQQITAMNKELSEALGKQLAAMQKQLAGMQSKLSTDLAPMAQQIRRVADLSKR